MLLKSCPNTGETSSENRFCHITKTALVPFSMKLVASGLHKTSASHKIKQPSLAKMERPSLASHRTELNFALYQAKPDESKKSSRPWPPG